MLGLVIIDCLNVLLVLGNRNGVQTGLRVGAPASATTSGADSVDLLLQVVIALYASSNLCSDVLIDFGLAVGFGLGVIVAQIN